MKKQIAIIGGGIASACAAYALCKQGINVTLYCKDNEIAQGASSNSIGALYPLLHQQQDNISDFYQQAFWRAKSLYTEVLEQGFHFSHQWCGVLDVAYKASLQNRQKTRIGPLLWEQIFPRKKSSDGYDKSHGNVFKNSLLIENQLKKKNNKK